MLLRLDRIVERGLADDRHVRDAEFVPARRSRVGADFTGDADRRVSGVSDMKCSHVSGATALFGEHRSYDSRAVAYT